MILYYVSCTIAQLEHVTAFVCSSICHRITPVICIVVLFYISNRNDTLCILVVWHCREAVAL